MKSFREAPLYANKEMLILVSATSTCDPGDIFATISEIKNLKITCSVIGLSGRNHIFKVRKKKDQYFKKMQRFWQRKLMGNMMSRWMKIITKP